jgi:DNA-binding PadR family transcriptional regulator
MWYTYGMAESIVSLSEIVLFAVRCLNNKQVPANLASIRKLINQAGKPASKSAISTTLTRLQCRTLVVKDATMWTTTEQGVEELQRALAIREAIFKGT